jgi:hypothetical protein
MVLSGCTAVKDELSLWNSGLVSEPNRTEQTAADVEADDD